MGFASGISSQLSGKVGTVIFRQMKNGTTVVYEKRRRRGVPRRSELQMRLRMQWGNLGAIYSQFHETLKRGFEGIGNKMSDYNAFIQSNIGVCKVYIPKMTLLNGGCVLAPYQITRGKLPSIGYAVNGESVLVSNVSLGELVINAETTVARFSAAVIACNDSFEEGDQLTFFYGYQTQDAGTGIPRARIFGFKVVLDTEDESLLWDVAGSIGFQTVNGGAGQGNMGFLGMDRAITEGAAAWIHTRESENGGEIKVSTQNLFVDSSVLESYQDDRAFKASADSYGGVNSQAVYLDPRSHGLGHGSGVNGSGLMVQDSSGSEGGSSGSEGHGSGVNGTEGGSENGGGSGAGGGSENGGGSDAGEGGEN